MPKGVGPKHKGNGVGAGPGWGGPAKGAGKPTPRAKPFAPGNDGGAGIEHKPRAEKNEALKAKLYHLAMNAEREEVQVRAIEAYLNRDEGMPVSRNLNFNTDDISSLDDDALADRQRELEAELRASAGGTAAPGNPKKPGGVVH